MMQRLIGDGFGLVCTGERTVQAEDSCAPRGQGLEQASRYASPLNEAYNYRAASFFLFCFQFRSGRAAMTEENKHITSLLSLLQ